MTAFPPNQTPETRLKQRLRRARGIYALFTLAVLLLSLLAFTAFHLRELDSCRLQAEQRSQAYFDHLTALPVLDQDDGRLYRFPPTDDSPDATLPPFLETQTGLRLEHLPAHHLLIEFAERMKREKTGILRLFALDPINPRNVADFVEREALEDLNSGKRVVQRRETIEGRDYLRSIYPLPQSPRCLRCHAPSRAHPSLIGGLSLSLPFESPQPPTVVGRYSGVVILVVFLAAMLALIYFVGWRSTVGYIRAQEEMRRRASLDPLTGVTNRPTLVLNLEREMDRARRLQTSISLVLVDIDHFKEINGRFGRKLGDVVLKRVADILRAQIRSYDLAGRTGGQELAVILPQTSLSTAAEIAERLRATVALEPVRHGTRSAPVTISLGVAELRPEMRTVDSLLGRAANALYNAKANGYNRVETDDVYPTQTAPDSTST